MLAAAGHGNTETRDRQPAVLNAPLFRTLADELESAHHKVVLDLGAASTRMLALLGRSSCLVEIADLARCGGIDALNMDVSDSARDEIAESLLPERFTADPVDYIFCWDLPNYLHPPGLSALMRAIAYRARPGARAHALVAYSERNMAAAPGRFLPTEDDKLVNAAAPGGQVAAPRYSPEDLGRIMDDFEIDRARLLANGMQEFLFRMRSR